MTAHILERAARPQPLSLWERPGEGSLPTDHRPLTTAHTPATDHWPLTTDHSLPTDHCRLRRPAFTLVELMVVVVIIAILGSIVMFSMFAAQGSAREAKTRTMIAKLNALIMPKYESYQYRRVPIRRNAGESTTSFTSRRLQALRDLMRIEMPERWEDIEPRNPNAQDPVSTIPVTGVPVPAMTRAYWRKVSSRHPTTSERRADENQSAEALYMIISLGLDEADAIGHFSQNDIGDTDSDDLPEFLDGWGNPIRYLRWPAGFNPVQGSALQSRAPIDLPANSPALNLQETDPNRRDFDQFNPRQLDDPYDSEENGLPRRFALYPLIVSAGPDAEFDITFGRGPTEPPVQYAVTGSGGTYVDPYYMFQDSGKWKQMGWRDANSNGSDEAVDNIHNHDLAIR